MNGVLYTIAGAQARNYRTPEAQIAQWQKNSN